jgi:hypothetical protein
MPDRAALTQRAILAGARAARHLPGPVGGMGVYFWAQQRLAEDPQSAPWREDVDVLLGRADAALSRGKIDAALRWFDKALRISYHGSLHQAGASPLAADPEGFLRAVRLSRTGRIMLPETPPAPREKTKQKKTKKIKHKTNQTNTLKQPYHTKTTKNIKLTKPTP